MLRSEPLAVAKLARISQWRVGREEKDPVKQRALMERAAAVLHAMHIKGKAPDPSEPIEISFDAAQMKHTRAKLTFDDKK